MTRKKMKQGVSHVDNREARHARSILAKGALIHYSIPYEQNEGQLPILHCQSIIQGCTCTNRTGLQIPIILGDKEFALGDFY